MERHPRGARASAGSGEPRPACRGVSGERRSPVRGDVAAQAVVVRVAAVVAPAGVGVVGAAAWDQRGVVHRPAGSVRALRARLGRSSHTPILPPPAHRPPARDGARPSERPASSEPPAESGASGRVRPLHPPNRPRTTEPAARPGTRRTRSSAEIGPPDRDRAVRGPISDGRSYLGGRGCPLAGAVACGRRADASPGRPPRVPGAPTQPAHPARPLGRSTRRAHTAGPPGAPTRPVHPARRHGRCARCAGPGRWPGVSGWRGRPRPRRPSRPGRRGG